MFKPSIFVFIMAFLLALTVDISKFFTPTTKTSQKSSK